MVGNSLYFMAWFLTIVRVITMLGGAALWLASMIVAWPTSQLMEPTLFLAGCASWVAYFVSTWAFTKI